MKPDSPIRALQKWQVLTRELLLDRAPWLSLWRETIRLPDGREIPEYYQIDQRDYVVVAAWQNNKVFGIWRYKHGPRRINLGLPAGYVEDGENPLTAARRELEEEAGLLSDDWRPLGSYCVDGNRSQSCAHLFVAVNCRATPSPYSDDLEEQIGEWLTPEEWRSHLAAGEVATLGAASAVYAGILHFTK